MNRNEPYLAIGLLLAMSQIALGQNRSTDQQEFFETRIPSVILFERNKLPFLERRYLLNDLTAEYNDGSQNVLSMLTISLHMRSISLL